MVKYLVEKWLKVMLILEKLSAHSVAPIGDDSIHELGFLVAS
jgi:hypothetical protein